MSVLRHRASAEEKKEAKLREAKAEARRSKSKHAVLSNYLYLPKRMVKDSAAFRRDFEYVLDLKKAPSARIKRQQMAVLEELGFLQDGLPVNEDEEIVLRTWSDAGKWWALSRGNLKKCRRVAKELGLKIVDKRVDAPLRLPGKHKLKLLVKLFDYQKKPFQEWLDAGYGMLNANPAFGKTVVMIAALCKLQQRTLVLVHTDALAEQFIERFRHGSRGDDGKYLRLTNCLDIEKATGKELIGRYSSGSKKSWPITVATYQSFIRDKAARRRLGKLSKNIGLLLVDEAHRAAAPSYAKVVNKIAARVRLSVSANEERKDQLQVVAADVIGPITAVGEAEQLPVDAKMMHTGFVYQGSKYPSRAEFTRMITKLLASESRNAFILKQARADVKAGRNVLILADRVEWVKEFARKLAAVGVRSGSIVGGNPSLRDAVILDMVKGKIKVIVATKVLDEGVDIKNLDTLYVVCPMSNAPVLKQRLGRIRRKYANKQRPLFRYFVDSGHGLLQGCANSTARALADLKIDVEFVQVNAKEKKKPGKSTEATGLERLALKRDGAKELFYDDERGKRSSSVYAERLKRGRVVDT